MANSVLADEILESFERIDQLEIAATEADNLLKSADHELQKCRDVVAQEAVVIAKDMERLKLELSTEEGQLPADLKTDYQRVINSKGADGMSPVEGQVCLGCGQQITLNKQNNLMMEKAVFCGSCGCLLYLDEA